MPSPVADEDLHHRSAEHERHVLQVALRMGARHPAVDHAECGFERGDTATAMAHRAGLGLAGIITNALAGNFHEAELAYGRRNHRRLVAAGGLAEFLVHRLAVGIGFHVDEVDDDEPVDVPEPELLRDFAAGVDIGLEDDLALVLAVHLRSGVHVDGEESLGLFDNEVPAAGKRHLALQGARIVVLYLEVFEQALAGAPELHLVQHVGSDFAQVVTQREVFVAVVDIHVVGVLVEVFADAAARRIGFLVNAGARSGTRKIVLGAAPLSLEEAHLLLQFLFGGVHAFGAHDVAHVACLEAVDHSLDLAATSDIAFVLGDADKVRIRHADQEVPGNEQAHGKPGALVAFGFLVHLHHDFVAFAERLLYGNFRMRIIIVVGCAGKGGIPVDDLVLIEDSIGAETHVHICQFRCRNDLLNNALINIAENRIGRSAIDYEFRKFAIFHDGIAGFIGRLANQNSTFALVRH